MPSGLVHSMREIEYGLPYLTCQSCRGKCDPTHRYHLQVDRIYAVDHKCARLFFDICADCYDRLFPWSLDYKGQFPWLEA
jgi:hypothetical protein